VLLVYRGWLEKMGRPIPPRWISMVGVVIASAVVWQHYATFVGDEAAGALLGLLVCIKSYELRSKRDYFVAVVMCLLNLMSYALSEQGLPLTLFLIADVALLVLFLMILESEEWSFDKGLMSNLRPVLFLALKALPLMAITFILFPRFTTGFGTGSPNLGKIGMSDVLRPGSVGQLISTDELIFRANFLNGDMPPRQSLYWRGAVLDLSEGLNWSRKADQEILPLPAAPTEKGDVEVYLEPEFDRFIYALDNTVNARFPRETRIQLKPGRVFELEQTLPARERYFLYNAATWPKEPIAKNESLATSIHPSKELKEFVRQNKRSTASASVTQLLRHFQQNGFAYSLTPPPVQNLEEFLFVTKVGFCEHYAATMATLLRLMGYPARVVVGFQGGTPSLLDSYLSVRASDAHAWVEYYELGLGQWRRADPTAQVDPLRIREGSDRYREIRPGWALGWMPSGWYKAYARVRAGFDEVDASWSAFLLQFDLARQKELLARLGMEGALFRALPVFLVLGVFLILAFLHFFESQRREPLTDEQKLYVQLLQLGRRWKLPKKSNEGPLTWLKRVESSQPHIGQALRPVLLEIVHIRYGQTALTAQTRSRVERGIKGLKKLSIIEPLR